MQGATTNLHPELTKILLELEKRMGFELHINSGYRDPEHNTDVGGVEGSEHTYDPAEGADVFCQRSITRFKMVRELLAMGVRRIGIGQTFVHVGIAKDKPQDAMWHYYPTKP
jgi:uncharacterized protein YcbK (DUF882 family)